MLLQNYTVFAGTIANHISLNHRILCDMDAILLSQSGLKEKEGDRLRISLNHRIFCGNGWNLSIDYICETLPSQNSG